MLMYTYTQYGSSHLGASFAPEIALAMQSRPDDSAGLPSTFLMRTGKYKPNVPGWQTHRRTYAIAHSFLQQIFPSRKWFTSSRKDADQRNLALFENPARQCNGARQLSAEHILTDAYNCS